MFGTCDLVFELLLLSFWIRQDSSACVQIVSAIERGCGGYNNVVDRRVSSAFDSANINSFNHGRFIFKNERNPTGRSLSEVYVEILGL